MVSVLKDKQTVPLHQRIKRSRFVSRIQEERIHIHGTSRSDKLDMEQFQPMMTSETVSVQGSGTRGARQSDHSRQEWWG